MHVQASGKKKVYLLHKLAKAKISPGKLPAIYHAIRLEPDPNDPAIGYKALPAKSWWVCIPLLHSFAKSEAGSCLWEEMQSDRKVCIGVRTEEAISIRWAFQ